MCCWWCTVGVWVWGLLFGRCSSKFGRCCVGLLAVSCLFVIVCGLPVFWLVGLIVLLCLLSGLLIQLFLSYVVVFGLVCVVGF